ncbi:MAG: hypothetical protein AAGD25_25340 [Cyanobacteria bacterium P01_F01_bin.150]
MAQAKLLDPDKSYTFRSYFEMPYDTDRILAEFGYAYSNQRLTLPRSQQKSSRLPAIQQQVEEILPLVILSSETAKRELLVAPLVIEIARFCQCQLRIEYGLTVNNWLKGELDYLMRSHQSLVVIEAKKDDLTRGFTQLAVELIAIATADEQETVYGAVTIGNAWVFGRLDNSRKQIIQDVTLYRVPDDMEELMSIMIGILSLGQSGKTTDPF